MGDKNKSSSHPPIVFEDENPFLLENVLIVFKKFVFGSVFTQFLFQSRWSLIRMAGGGWKKIFQKLSISRSKRKEKKPKLNYHQENESQGNLNFHLNIANNVVLKQILTLKFI